MFRDNREPINNTSWRQWLNLHQGLSHFTNSVGVPIEDLTRSGDNYAAILTYPSDATREGIPLVVKKFAASIFVDAPIDRIAIHLEKDSEPGNPYERTTIVIDVQETPFVQTAYSSQVELCFDNPNKPYYFVTRSIDGLQGKTGRTSMVILSAVAFMLPDRKARSTMKGYEEFFPYYSCTSQEPIKELIRYRGRMYQ